MKPHSTLPLLAAVVSLAPWTPIRSAGPPDDAFTVPNSPGTVARPIETAPRRPLTPPPRPDAGAAPARFPADFRPLDGAGTNLAHPDWGLASTPFLRLAPPAYGDGASTPSGADRPGARAVSNAVVAQAELIPAANRASAMVWQWGQFIDHDLDLSPVASPEEAFDVPVPAGDPTFDPQGRGNAVIALDRTLATPDANGVRQQINDLTAFMDASMVYGVSDTRARALRALDGTGRLKTSAGNLLPFNADGLPNAPAGAAFFLAGDVRVNEQVGLMAIQTVFVREHNHWADYFRAQDASLTDDGIYLRARAIVAAEIQAITYREFLPVLLGANALRPYRGYRPEVNPAVANEFATAAYRVGHTMLSPTLLRLTANGTAHPDGELTLVGAFFNVPEITRNGIEPILSGLTAQIGQEVDTQLVDAVRNFLFGAPGSPGFDLASLNIQRGRDHGLPGYIAVRRALGLRPMESFGQITPDLTLQARLQQAYPTVEQIDLWVGGLAEPHVGGGMVGETFRAIIRDQFERTRDGDRFWYESYLPPEWVRCVERQTLATILARNAVTPWRFPANAFVVGSAKSAPAAALTTAKRPAPKAPRPGAKRARR